MRDEFSVTVNKDELLAALQSNRDSHRVAFEKAKTGYIRITTAKLKEALEQLDRGEMLHHVLSDIPPADHTPDYDDAIDVMQWSVEDTIELTQTQFKQYVKDDWNWKRQWTVSNTAYLQG